MIQTLNSLSKLEEKKAAGEYPAAVLLYTGYGNEGNAPAAFAQLDAENSARRFYQVNNVPTGDPVLDGYHGVVKFMGGSGEFDSGSISAADSADSIVSFLSGKM